MTLERHDPDFEDDGASFHVRRRWQLEALEALEATPASLLRAPRLGRSVLIHVRLMKIAGLALVLLLGALALVILVLWIYEMVTGQP